MKFISFPVLDTQRIKTKFAANIIEGKLEKTAWILFVLSAIGFIIASIDSFWTTFALVFFLLACLVVLISIFGKHK